MKIATKWILVTAIVTLAGLLAIPVWLPVARAAADHVRWDIIHMNPATTPNTLSPGGVAFASARNPSSLSIKLTGSGTFTVGDDDVSGGGTWKTFAPDGTTVTGKGDYRVTLLVRFEVAPGHQTSVLHDNIGDGTLTDNRAGLAILRVAYDDGSKGILAVSCHLSGNPPPQGPDAAPASIFEGITASKGFVDYWNRVAPTGSPGTANANRTLFHILSGD